MNAPGLHWVDWSIIAAYLASMLALGWGISRRQTGTAEYHRRGALNPSLVGITYLIVGYWLFPALMRRRSTSAYELLEEHLGVVVRLLGAGSPDAAQAGYIK